MTLRLVYGGCLMTEAAMAPVLHVSLLQPVGVEGCPACGAAAAARASARKRGDAATEREANETIQQHPHRRSTDYKGVLR